MHPDHERCFAYFLLNDISIIGSSVRNMETAHDIDILFAGSEDFPAVCRRLGVKYNGWEAAGYHVRRASFRHGNIEKPIHLLSWGDHELGHCRLLRNGTHVNPGRFYDKETGLVIERTDQ